MCGICGYVSKNQIDEKVLITMRDTMVHRGPDDAGIWQSCTSNMYIGLAHRRLSIFDLSELGHQPMHFDDEYISIVFNGEIYNFKEIRDELKKEGYVFKSECDTEVILCSYDKWNTDCFSKFNGMFAIAIWDKKEEKLVVARDRMGVKPLYYYYDEAKSDFVFASEMKPIMKYPYFKKDINMESLGKYFCNKYIAAPNTIFKNTFKLLPGTYVTYKNNKITTKCYWDILAKKKNCSKSIITNFQEAKNELDGLLTDAVNRRMVADVPVGMFLSSGIDSALVTAIAQKNHKTPVKTFTIGFNDKERNEADRAKEIAKYLGTEHIEVYIGEKEIFDMLEDISKYYDEPFSDSSQLPTMLVSRLARENVTVALSGDGGDELFCGYKMYDLVNIAQKSDIVGNLLYHTPIIGKELKKISPEIKAFINNRDKKYKTQLFTDVFVNQMKRIIPELRESDINGFKHPFERNLTFSNWQERRMILDMTSYLPDEVMAKTDRASMKYSLEVRSPLLDYRVVEKSFEIPHKYKYHNGIKKYILKQLAYDYIPKDLLTGPKKGFGVPLKKWLRGPLKEEIQHYSENNYLMKQGLFDGNEVQKLINNQQKSNSILYSSVLWSFYMFQRWWEEYM